jgi:hypothetical protein
MEKDEFIRRLNRKTGPCRVYSISVHNYLWTAYAGLRMLTEHIDYDCQFDEKGVCKRNRDYRKLSFYNRLPVKQQRMCCCSSCKSSVGYLRVVPKELISEYARKFSKHTGFWRDKKGCVLPRAMRSTICLCCSCSEPDDSILKDKIDGLRIALEYFEKQIEKTEGT